MPLPSTAETSDILWRQQARLLRATAIALAEAIDAQETLDVLVRQIAQLGGFRLGQAFLVSPDQRQLTWCAAWHEGSPELAAFVNLSRQLDLAKTRSLPGAVLLDKTTYIRDGLNSPLDASRRDEAAAAGLCAALAVPVLARGNLVAVLEFHRPEPISPDGNAPILAELLAAHFGTAVALRAAEAQRDGLACEERSARVQVEALSRRLMSVRESERREISRDLHDEVGQVVTALKLSLETAGHRMESTKAALATLMKQIRNLSMKCRPPMLDDLGLVPTLEWHFRQYTAQTGVRVRFRRFGACGRYHPDLEIALYRTVQEALTNVARYAGVPAARVVLCVEPDRIGLRIRDRGTSFDPGRVPQGSTGITGMRERLRPFLGKLTIQSERGRGTAVTARVPAINHEVRTMTEAITVVVADDHKIVREALKNLLESGSFQVVGEAGDGLDAVAVTERVKPNVLLLDVAMPGLGGMDVVKQVVKRAPHTQVLMLSMYAADTYVNSSIKNGAAGYALKDIDAAELFHAIREVAAGRRYLSTPLEESGAANGELNDPYETLTMREREVLHLAAEGLTSAQIADRLSISPRTAETHRANSLRKLGIRGQTELVRYAIGRGILTDSA